MAPRQQHALSDPPCASKVMGCWPLWLLSLLVSHCPSLGHLCSYQLSFMKLSSTFEPCLSKLSHRTIKGGYKDMAEYGEWNKKGATLSDVTAQKEYGISRDFIIKGINSGQLEYHEGSIWGNPYIRVLRSQLEKYISDQLGHEYLMTVKNKAELRAIKKEMDDLGKRMDALQKRKAEIESTMK